jgi:HSP20 family protein
MTTLVRWDPFRDMTALRNMMDRLVDEPVFENAALWQRSGGDYALALDLLEDDDAYTVKASVPGVDPGDLDVSLADNVLTIKGETHDENDVEEKQYHLHERRYGSFSRSVTLPVTVDADNVEATHENGVLTLRLPKSEAVKPKKIAVKKMIQSN